MNNRRNTFQPDGRGGGGGKGVLFSCVPECLSGLPGSSLNLEVCCCCCCCCGCGVVVLYLSYFPFSYLSNTHVYSKLFYQITWKSLLLFVVG